MGALDPYAERRALDRLVKKARKVKEGVVSEAKDAGKAAASSVIPGGQSNAREYRDSVIRRSGAAGAAGKFAGGAAKTAAQVESVTGSTPQTAVAKALGGAVQVATDNAPPAGSGAPETPADTDAATVTKENEQADLVDLNSIGGGLAGSPRGAGGKPSTHMEYDFSDHGVPKSMDYEGSDLFAGKGADVENARSHLSEDQLIADRKSQALRQHGNTLEALYKMQGNIAQTLGQQHAAYAKRIGERVAAGKELWRQLDEVDKAAKKEFNRALSKPVDPITRGSTGFLGMLAKIAWSFGSESYRQKSIQMVDMAARNELAQAKMRQTKLDAWGQARRNTLAQFQRTLGQNELADRAFMGAVRGMYAEKLRSFAMNAAAPEVKEQALIAAQALDERGREERLRFVATHRKEVPDKATGAASAGGIQPGFRVQDASIQRDKKGSPIGIQTKVGFVKAYTMANDNIAKAPSWQLGGNAGPKYFLFSSPEAASRFQEGAVNATAAISNLRAMRAKLEAAARTGDTGAINALLRDVSTSAQNVTGQWAKSSGMGSAMTDKEYARAAQSLTGNAGELSTWQGRVTADLLAKWRGDKRSPLQSALAAMSEAEQVFLRHVEASASAQQQLVATGPEGSPEVFFVDMRNRPTMPKDNAMAPPAQKVTADELRESKKNAAKAALKGGK